MAVELFSWFFVERREVVLRSVVPVGSATLNDVQELTESVRLDIVRTFTAYGTGNSGQVEANKTRYCDD